MPGKVVTPEEWRAARVKLLEKEKAHTRAGDALAAEVRELPVVAVTKDYQFTDLDGSTKTLKDLFGGKEQLVIYHLMFAPEWEDPCHGCSFTVDHFPDVRHLASKKTAFFAVSRSPVAKIAAIKKKSGWKFPWVSSQGSDFNYDYHVTLDEKVHPLEYNFQTKEDFEAKDKKFPYEGEMPGYSVFKLEEDGKIYHTYSAYARGGDKFLTTLTLLDVTPLGRQDGPMGPGSYKRIYEYDEE